MKKRFAPIYSILALAIILLGILVPSCNGGTRTFALTMAVYPPGSGTAQDLTGGSPYTSGTVVNITAAPLGSYQFVKWTAPAGTFANANLAPTQFTMPAQNVTATANFRGPLDHFKCYSVANASRVDKSVTLTDQFLSINVTVGQAVWFANPARKTHNQTVKNIMNPDDHFTFYSITYAGEPQTWYVEVSNQFGNYTLTVSGPHMLAVPTQKVEPGNHRPPLSLDHFLVYQVVNGPLIDVGVGLDDQFGNETSVVVGETFLFANPAQKAVPGAPVIPILHPDEHLVFYNIPSTQVPGTQVKILNQFTPPAAAQTLNLGTARLLGVPSKKTDFGEQIDHFTCYPLPGGEPPIGQAVRLKDQFVDINATVEIPFSFCNPAAKSYQGMTPILNPDYHFTMYMISGVEPKWWFVDVSNQFDRSGPQHLMVYGPVALAVPTQKLIPGNHTFPEGLDHYLLYLIPQVPPLNITIGLADQFSPDPGVTVLEPYFFANPVQKTVGDVVFPILNEMAHLVFYKISGNQISYPPFVQVINQFATHATNYYLSGRSNYLAVPSAKLHSGVPD